MSYTKSQQQYFGRMLNKYKEVKLKPLEVKKDISRKYVPIEENLIEYVNVRAMSYKQEKCATSWGLLKEKCKKWAEDLGFFLFK